MRRWTEEEIQAMKELYPKGGSSAVSQVITRSPEAIMQMAKALGIRTEQDWTEEEDRLIWEQYAESGPTKLAQVLGRSALQVRQRRFIIGAPKKNRQSVAPPPGCTPPTPGALRAARERAGLSQTAAAEQVCVALNTWSQWERGLRQMPAGLWKLFRLLHPGG